MKIKERKEKEVWGDSGRRGIFLIHMEEGCSLAAGALASAGDLPVKVYKKSRKWKSEQGGRMCCVFLLSPATGFPPRRVHVVERWARLRWRVAPGEWDVPGGGHHLASAHCTSAPRSLSFQILLSHSSHSESITVTFCFYFLISPSCCPLTRPSILTHHALFSLSTFLSPSSLTFYHAVSCFLLSHFFSQFLLPLQASLPLLHVSFCPLPLHSPLFVLLPKS